MKKISLWLVCWTLSLSLHAALVEQKSLLFAVDGENLPEGTVHYALRELTVGELLKESQGFADIMGQQLKKKDKARISVIKLAYQVNRPVGFFSSGQMIDPSWLSKILGGEVKKAGEERQFFSANWGKFRVYFDSDDLSTIQSSRLMHAITQSKRLDMLSLSSASTVLYRSKSQFQVDNFIPLSPSKSLVITYYIAVAKGPLSAGQAYLRQVPDRLRAAYP